MDCRGSLGLAACLLSVALGCQHQTMPVSMQDQTPPDPSQIKKASSLPKKEPPPSVLVSWGNFKAGEACAADIPPERQQQIRDAARQDYERALKTDPKYVPAYQGLARLYAAMQNPALAVETYQKAIQIAPNNARLWYELGLTHNFQHNREPALECLSRALQLEPSNRDCANTLAVVLATAGRYQESLDCFVRVSGEAKGYYRMAQTLQRLQQPELSRQYLDAALQKDPNLAALLPGQNAATSASTSTIQRTSYQAPSEPAPPAAPSTPAEPDPLPRIIQGAEIGTNAAASSEAPPQSFDVPPPPPLILHYSDPDEMPKEKP